MPDSAAARREPRWPAIMAVLSVSALYWALPESLSPGPGWLALALVTPLSLAGMLLHRRSRFALNEIVGYATLTILTAALVGSLVLLIAALPDKKEAPR